MITIAFSRRHLYRARRSSKQLLLLMSEVISLRERVAQAELQSRIMDRLPSQDNEAREYGRISQDSPSTTTARR
jgi:hypothetical protein